MPLNPKPSTAAGGAMLRAPSLADRIQALHAWYARNVLALRLTPEVERLWFEWLKAGYNGNDLRDVVRYIRRQISAGKRNEGALKLSNLFARSESGFLKFDEDLGLARARGNLSVDKKLEPSPDGPQGSPMSKAQSPKSGDGVAHRAPLPDPVKAQRALDDFRKAKEQL